MSKHSVSRPLTTAQAMLSYLRAAVTPEQQAAQARTNTKAPIAEADQATVRAHIEQHQPAWLLTWYDLSVATGWRTADVANLSWSAIDWEKGRASIIVSKQTKAAQARALGKGLREVQEARKAAALAANDAPAFMRWSAATRDELTASASPAEINRLAELVASAPVKRDTKVLSPALLARLKAMKDAATWDQGEDDGHVFSRRLTSSNSSRGTDAPITRATIWARMKAVFSALADKVANAAELSAYSTRKAFAVGLYMAAGKSIAAVMRAMGHSSEAMSLKYMGLDDAAAEAQARWVGVAA